MFRSMKQLRSIVNNGKQTRKMSILNADNGVMGTRIHHLSNIILLGLLPVAFIGEPTFQFPVDCILGTVIPLHAHIGLNSVISDYVPKVLRTFCRVGVLGLSITAFIGLTQLNFSGPGITACIKALWKSPKSKENQ